MCLLHIYQNGKLSTFTQLRELFGIPRNRHFHYAQLHHAAVAQFGGGEVRVQNTALERSLIDPNPAKCISRHYREVGPGLIAKARSHWVAVVPELSEELWQEALDTYLVSVISSTGKIIQLRYLNSTYLAYALPYAASWVYLTKRW